MSTQQRMDAAYGRRGGRLTPWSGGPPRPEIGPATLDLGKHGSDAVEIVALLGRRRCRIKFPSGSLLVVPDRLLR